MIKIQQCSFFFGNVSKPGVQKMQHILTHYDLLYILERMAGEDGIQFAGSSPGRPKGEITSLLNS